MRWKIVARNSFQEKCFQLWKGKTMRSIYTNANIRSYWPHLLSMKAFL